MRISTDVHLQVSIVVHSRSDDGSGLTKSARCESIYGFGESDLEDPVRFVAGLKQEIERRKKEVQLA
jgi:hypothetical protein